MTMAIACINVRPRARASGRSDMQAMTTGRVGRKSRWKTSSACAVMPPRAHRAAAGIRRDAGRTARISSGRRYRIPEQCWQLDPHKFIRVRRCPQKRMYHDNMEGCGAIDRFIVDKTQHERLRYEMLHQYDIVNYHDLNRRRLSRGLIPVGDIEAHSRFVLQKRRPRRDVTVSEYSSIPDILQASWFGTIRNMPTLIQWLANCAVDRIGYRTDRVVGCDPKLADTNHDEFIHKLQILYAQAMVRLRDYEEGEIDR